VQGRLKGIPKGAVPARLRLSEWEEALNGKGPTLCDYLAHLYSGGKGAPGSDDWDAALRQSSVLLLMDGLDEVGPGFNSILQRTLARYRTCPTVISCRAASFQERLNLRDGFRVASLVGFTPQQRSNFVRNYPAQDRERWNADELIAFIESSSAVATLAENPLILSIICSVQECSPDLTSLTSLNALLEQTTLAMVRRPQDRKKIRYPGDVEGPDVSTKRQALESLALSMHGDGDDTSVLANERAAIEAFDAFFSREKYGQAVRPWSVALISDFVHNSGILQGDGSRRYRFRHLVFRSS
jgi:hypothetical protein